MKFFKSQSLRWFLIFFVIGALFSTASFVSEEWKDFKMSVGKRDLTGAAAQSTAALLCGILSGSCGLIIVSLKNRIAEKRAE